MTDRNERTGRPGQAPATSRRDFLRGAALGAAALGAGTAGVPVFGGAAPATPFKLKYAPSLGSFPESAGRDPIDQVRFMSDQGFQAMFDNGLMNRSTQMQEAIGREMERRRMLLGPFVAYADFGTKSFVTRDPAVRTMLEARLKHAIETARRAGARWALVVPGRFDESLERDYQTANVIENLKWAAGVVAGSALTLVVEPLNPHDHPGLFLTGMPQAYQICKAVGSPAVKIVEDLYHQQITEGNLIPNLEACWDEIAALHVGDNPGRKEPGTGEINYRNVFRRLAEKRYDGVICMEHGQSLPGRDGEAAVIAAYRACDSFS